MSKYVKNPLHFAAECTCTHGECAIRRENVAYFDNGDELAAVDHLQKKCGHVVIIPDPSHGGKAMLYHSGCDRMTDLVKQVFQERAEPAGHLPHANAEMSVGAFRRQSLSIPYEDCKGLVDRFSF